MPSRYENQIALDDVGIEGQIKIKNAKVIVFGAGGLGSSVIANLAGAGVGSLTIVDGDAVEKKNLQRQFIHTFDRIGMNKSQSAWHFVNDYNPDIQVVYDARFANPDTIEDIFFYSIDSSKTNIIVDAGDSAILSYLLNEICAKYNVYLVSGSGLKYAGYSAVYGLNAPSYSDVFSTILSTQSCSSQGVSGATVGVIGNIMAQTVLNIICEDYSDIGKLYKINTKPLSITTLDISSIKSDEKDIMIISVRDIDETDVLVNIDLEVTNPILTQAGVEHLNLDDLIDFPLTYNRVVFLGNDESRLLQAHEILKRNDFERIAICPTEKIHVRIPNQD